MKSVDYGIGTDRHESSSPNMCSCEFFSTLEGRIKPAEFAAAADDDDVDAGIDDPDARPEDFHGLPCSSSNLSRTSVLSPARSCPARVSRRTAARATATDAVPRVSLTMKASAVPRHESYVNVGKCDKSHLSSSSLYFHDKNGRHLRITS